MNRVCEINCGTFVDDILARKLIKKWEKVFPDAHLLPNYANGVVVITHTLTEGAHSKINGLPSRSMLVNNAFFSTEVSKGRYINLYSVKIPDLPGKRGEPSTAQIYIQQLVHLGLDVQGISPSWMGVTLTGEDCGLVEIKHMKIEMNPSEFTKRTITALARLVECINSRISGC